MTVSYKKSTGDGAYYTNCMDPANQTNFRSMDEYYSSTAKEPPGKWYVGIGNDGTRNSIIGIQDGAIFNTEEILGVSDSKRFKTLCKGFQPDTGEALTQNSGSDKRLSFHDWTLSAPKSVSVAFGLADEDIRESITAAQDSGSKAYLDFLSKHAYTRTGKGSKIKVAAALQGATFNHGSSRANDPQLHTHGVVFNVCQRPDGTTGALETLELMKWQGAAASLYHAKLAFELKTIGFGIVRDGNLFEIEGVPKEICEAFSKRHTEIKAAVEKKLAGSGMSLDSVKNSRGLFQVATLETRDAKNEITREELYQRWNEESQKLGFTGEHINKLIAAELDRQLGVEQPTRDELMVEARKALKAITENNAIFREPTLITQVTVHLMGYADTDQILEICDELKNNELLKAEYQHKETGEIETVYTTKEHVMLERDMLRYADKTVPEGKFIIRDSVIDKKLTAEQTEAYVHVMTDQHMVSVIEGAPGTGKSFLMGAITKTHHEADPKRQIFGLSNSWEAAKGLGETLNKEFEIAQALALTGFLNSVEKGELTLNNSLLIVDEAGMSGAQEIHKLLKLANTADNCKIVLLGDTLQQKSIAAGDSLRVIAHQNGSIRMTDIVRQNNKVERQASKDFLNGNAKDALKPYIDKDHVHILSTDEETNARMVTDYLQSRADRPGDIHLMIAVDKKSVAELNRITHQKRQEAGELGEAKSFANWESSAEHPTVEFSIGEEVIFRKSEKDSGIKNKTRGVIVGFQGKSIIKVLVGKKEILVDTADEKWHAKRDKQAPSLALTHAYASTTYSSQGVTVNHCFVKDSTALKRDSAGVAMSRHKDTCQVYIDRQARYEAKLSRMSQEDWHPIEKFTDDECLARVATSWSQENVKHSTLDFENWTKPNGAEFNVEREYENELRYRTRESAAMQPLVVREKRVHGDFECQQNLKFQDEPFYILGRSDVDVDTITKGLTSLKEDKVHADAIDQAMRQDFFSISPNGEPVFHGKNGNGQIVLKLSDDKDVEKKDILRDTFRPILYSDDPACKDFLLVKTGKDALLQRSLDINKNLPQKHVMVIGEKKPDSPIYISESVKKVLEQAKSVKSVESQTLQKENTQAAAMAKAEAARLAAEAAAEAERQRHHSH